MNLIELISELIFGKRMPYQSEVEYEAGNILSIGCWLLFIIPAVIAIIRFLG